MIKSRFVAWGMATSSHLPNNVMWLGFDQVEAITEERMASFIAQDAREIGLRAYN